MKKLKYIKYAVVSVLLLSFAGCNDILESVEPSTSVSGEVALTSVDGVNSIRASMYSKIREQFSFTTDHFVGPSAFTDELFIRPGASRYNNLNQAIGTSGTAHLGNWTGAYQIIQDANLLIGAIADGVLDADTQARYEGEAYAIRAFIMHNLVRVYGYEPGNFSQGPEANWDAGVIIRTEPVIDVVDADFRPRSSVNAVYTQIFEDLNNARTRLAGINANNTFATEAFVDGIAARASLYAGEWADAASYAQDAITKSGRTLENTADGVAEMFFEGSGGNHPEALFKIVVNPNTEASTGGGTFVNNGPAGYTSDQWVSQLPTQTLVDKYDPADFRLGWYAPCGDAQRIGAPASGCDQVNSNGWSITKFNGVKGNAVDDLPYMRIAEMYLIRAEGLAKANNSPAAGAGALDELRTARGLDPIAVANPGALLSLEAFEDEILDERMRELAVEGHRFFDLKRLGRDIRDRNGNLKMFADSYRILAPIGNTILNENPELVENPVYN